ncbi:hypothetical protein [Paenibacillus sp. NPDC058071]|uniref:hypothetical protein n=1 Tax=Paenibacillus sp. NPDC058071 TaxID=3346326 RepID=UPI0036DBCD08
MSSIIILKDMENYSPEQTISHFIKAAERAKMYCFYITTKLDKDGYFFSAEGTLSEVDEITFTHIDDEEDIRYFTFNINRAREDLNDSFTWLTEDKGYFWAVDIENINHEYEFIFRFVIEYFKENSEDNLWFDDADWYYSAADILKLSQMPYNPEWCSKKIL